MSLSVEREYLDVIRVFDCVAVRALYVNSVFVTIELLVHQLSDFDHADTSLRADND
jgi:hypothetical protein